MKLANTALETPSSGAHITHPQLISEVRRLLIKKKVTLKGLKVAFAWSCLGEFYTLSLELPDRRKRRAHTPVRYTESKDMESKLHISPKSSCLWKFTGTLVSVKSETKVSNDLPCNK